MVVRGWLSGGSRGGLGVVRVWLEWWFGVDLAVVWGGLVVVVSVSAVVWGWLNCSSGWLSGGLGVARWWSRDGSMVVRGCHGGGLGWLNCGSGWLNCGSGLARW